MRRGCRFWPRCPEVGARSCPALRFLSWSAAAGSGLAHRRGLICSRLPGGRKGKGDGGRWVTHVWTAPGFSSPSCGGLTHRRDGHWHWGCGWSSAPAAPNPDSTHWPHLCHPPQDGHFQSPARMPAAKSSSVWQCLGAERKKRGESHRGWLGLPWKSLRMQAQEHPALLCCSCSPSASCSGKRE